MIQFIKDHNEHKVGDKVNHPNEDYLVRVGVAKLVSDKVSKKKKDDTED